jgi:hypothetical protein
MTTDLTEQSPEAAASSGDFNLGTWLGRRQAFGIMAGKASAADAECLRLIRDKKLYKSKTPNWREFCTRYLGLSKTNADRIIQYLDEFGPNYFQLTQIKARPHKTMVCPTTYLLYVIHIGETQTISPFCCSPRT